MSEKLISPNVQNFYDYKETYIAGATKYIPLTFEIDIFKHKTIPGAYCATEIKTHMVEYEENLSTEEEFRDWAKRFHFIFTHSPSEVERRLQRQGFDMWGRAIKNHDVLNP